MVLRYCMVACAVASVAIANADQLQVAEFSRSSPEGWEEKVFSGATSYQWVELGGNKVLRAESRDSASGFVRKRRVDLREHPFLNWSWRIESRLYTQHEKTKPGDDFAARVYVVVDGGLFFWRTKALNYVWANEIEKGESWWNPFARKNVIMMALRNRKDETSTWYGEKRNVYADLKELFGREVRFIDGVALMTDTDNNHEHVVSYYGDIYFSVD